MLLLYCITMQHVLSSKLIPETWTLQDIKKKKVVVEETRDNGVTAESPTLAATFSFHLHIRNM